MLPGAELGAALLPGAGDDVSSKLLLGAGHDVLRSAAATALLPNIVQRRAACRPL